jgi:hypothetical protein
VIYRSAIVRYLTINMLLRADVGIIFKRPKPQRIVKSIGQKPDIKQKDSIARHALMTHAASWIVRRLKEVNTGSRVIIVNDADRKGIYRRKPKDLEQNRIIRAACTKERVLCIDMTGPMFARYLTERQSFDFGLDRHYNAYGHRVMAEIIHEELVRHGVIAGS